MDITRLDNGWSFNTSCTRQETIRIITRGIINSGRPISVIILAINTNDDVIIR